MKKRLAAFLILLAMLLPTLVACGGGGTETSGSNDNTTDGTVETTTGMFQEDSIPDDIDYGGETINIFAWEDATMPEFEVESATGENVVEDAIYYRNREVERRLGVKLNVTMQPGKDSNVDAWVAKVEQAAMGNTGEYDILAGFSTAIGQCATSGYAYNLLDFDVIDFSAPWWSQDLVHSSTINGGLYFASGDVSTNLIYMMNNVFFNTTMIADLGLDSPYDLVQQDKWFLTTMLEMGNGLYEDLNNNFTKDSSDKFGTVHFTTNYSAYYFGYGLKATEIVDGVPEFTEDYFGTATRDFIVLMIEHFMNDNDNFDKNAAYEVRGIFGANRALFLVDSPFTVPMCLDDYVDCLYGIVPVPKRDEYQEKYRTGMRTTYTFYTLFAGTPDPERAATVLECLASEGYRQVTPAVFEVTMKYQYALDDVASRMFDLIRDNIVYETTRNFHRSFANEPVSTVTQRIQAKDTDWISFVGRFSHVYETVLDKLVTTLADAYD